MLGVPSSIVDKSRGTGGKWSASGQSTPSQIAPTANFGIEQGSASSRAPK